MSDPYLTVSSSYGTVAFNGVQSSGHGVEAQPGATGLGLPPIEATFNAGAGDGATYVGRRVASRQLEIPITILAEDRSGLRQQMRDLSKVITAEGIVLRWVDPEATTTHRLNVQLVGGGDYNYGTDTEGSYWARTTLNFQSEDPFWVNEESITEAVVSNAFGEFTYVVNNPGSATAEPVWTIEGPTEGFEIECNGRRIQYDAIIPPDQSVRIDVSRGTVMSSHGENVYRNLGPVPDFFKLAPGGNEVEVTTTSYPLQLAGSTTNLIRNPTFGVNTEGWTPWSDFDFNDHLWTRSQVNGQWGLGMPQTQADTPWSHAADVEVAIPAAARGKQRTLSFDARTVHGGSVLFSYTKSDRSVSVGSGSLSIPPSTDVTRHTYAQAIPAEAEFVFFTFLPAHSAYIAYPFWISRVYFGEPGDYFDGDTPDGGYYTYDWSGAPHLSTSIKTIRAGANPTPSVSLTYNPRDWLVI